MENLKRFRKFNLRRLCLVFITVICPILCLATTYNMTVGESRSFTPFTGSKYNDAILSYMSLSDDTAFEIKQSTSSTNKYLKTYKLTALKTGTYTVLFEIQYKSGNSYPSEIKQHTINVFDVTSITIPKELSLTLGETYTYSPIIEDSQASTSLEWTSDNSEIVSVDGPTITAKAIGSAIITCKAHNGVKTTSQVTVTPAYISQVNLNFQEYELPIYNKFQLIAEIQPSNATNQSIDWISSDNNVAIVREDGSVIGINLGYALITAKTLDGSNKSASCLVHVVENIEQNQILSLSDSECGKIEIKIGKELLIRLVANDDWIPSLISINDEPFESIKEDWIPLKSSADITNIVIVWEKVATSNKELTVRNALPFKINYRTLEFLEEIGNPIFVTDIYGSIVFEGCPKNVILPSSGYYIINLGYRTFKIYIP